MKPCKIKFRPEAPPPQLCFLVTSFIVRFLVLDTEEDSKWLDCLLSSCFPCRIEENFDRDECELLLVTEFWSDF